jgi:tRNA (guanine37-N1)-methyltransferase
VWFGVVTLFPEMFAVLDYGITGRAIKTEALNVSLWNPRDFTQDKHRTVDDRPYGGGPGMMSFDKAGSHSPVSARQAIQPGCCSRVTK